SEGKEESVILLTLPFAGFCDTTSLRAEGAVGSGSLISPEGLVLTSASLVQDAQTVAVTLADGREFEAEVIGFGEAGVDLAAVKISGQPDLPSLRLAHPDSIRVGQRTFVIGDPFGRFQGTFTTGIVSRFDANRGLVQTDAALNPGDLGGPLLNNQGEIIGVTTAVFSPGQPDNNIGINFAIAVNQVESFLTALREGRAPRVVQNPYTHNAQPILLNSNPVDGALTEASNVLASDNSYYNSYTFEGKAGEQVMIELFSPDFDAFLILIAPNGRETLQDNDGAGGTNARIIATLPENGTYVILANAYESGATGSYSLRVLTTAASAQTRR
ncbi:trypsin-like peptidase domain-containing protein, partial [Phormidium tenue FACHB-886]|nr:trypsin-like peptidase domain-containing protein [Phormidium tenue FACHB-886]